MSAWRRETVIVLKTFPLSNETEINVIIVQLEVHLEEIIFGRNYFL